MKPEPLARLRPAELAHLGRFWIQTRHTATSEPLPEAACPHFHDEREAWTWTRARGACTWCGASVPAGDDFCSPVHEDAHERVYPGVAERMRRAGPSWEGTLTLRLDDGRTLAALVCSAAHARRCIERWADGACAENVQMASGSYRACDLDAGHKGACS